jgi:DNA primase
MNSQEPDEDIVSIVSQVVALERRGPNVYVGLCPFHEEKTPSFLVNDKHQVFACLSCGSVGTAEDFMEKYTAQGA